MHVVLTYVRPRTRAHVGEPANPSPPVTTRHATGRDRRRADRFVEMMRGTWREWALEAKLSTAKSVDFLTPPE